VHRVSFLFFNLSIPGKTANSEPADRLAFILICVIFGSKKISRFYSLSLHHILKEEKGGRTTGGIHNYKESSLSYDLYFPFFVFHLCPQRSRTVRAEIFEFVAIRQNEEKTLAYRDSLAAAGAKQGTGFVLIIGRLRSLLLAGMAQRSGLFHKII
jgi:hypothetical protein